MTPLAIVTIVVYLFGIHAAGATIDTWWQWEPTRWQQITTCALWPIAAAALILASPYLASQIVRKRLLRSKALKTHNLDDLLRAQDQGAMTAEEVGQILYDKALERVGQHRLSHYEETETRPKGPSWPTQPPAPMQLGNPVEVPQVGTIEL